MRRDARAIDRPRADDNLKRVTERIQKSRPAIENRALLGLAFDAEGERRALQYGAQSTTSEANRRAHQRVDRQQRAGASLSARAQAADARDHGRPPTRSRRGRARNALAT